MRRVGIGAVREKGYTAAKFQAKADELAQDRINTLKKQAEKVKNALEDFAFKHKDKIRKDPQFRKHFQDMCTSIGVDPLSCSKGQWSSALGLGELYFKLGVKVVEICLAYQPQNGGLMAVDDIVKQLNRRRGRNDDLFSEDDVVRAIKQLHCLGTGFSIIQANGSKRPLVQSVPLEINLELTNLIASAEKTNGCLSASEAAQEFGWTEERVVLLLDQLVKEGIAWIDKDEALKGTFYWIPSLFVHVKM